MLRKRPSPARHKAGFTLVEIAIVIGVIAIIIGGIWMIVKVVYENQREYQARLQIQTIARNFRQLYSRVDELKGPGGGGLQFYNTILDQQDAVPPEMRVNPGASPHDGKLNHPWSTSQGGSVTVMYGGIDPATNQADQFSVHLSGLPRKACAALATHLSSGELSGLKYIQIDSGGCYGTDSSCPNSLPIGVVAANTECKFADNALLGGKGNNDIVIMLGIR